MNLLEASAMSGIPHHILRGYADQGLISHNNYIFKKEDIESFTERLKDSTINDIGWTIWNIKTGNLVGTFSSEDDALATLKEEIDGNGSESIDGWALGRTDWSGEIYSGEALIQRIQLRENR